MSIEILLRKYQFMSFKANYTHKTSFGIYANYLHDLESIFWIIIWTMFLYRKETFETIDLKPMYAQKDAGSELFSKETQGVLNRKYFLTSKEIFTNRMKSIPEYYKNIKELATTFKDHLIKAYDKEERKITANDPILRPKNSIYRSILKTFRSHSIPDGDAGLMLSPIESSLYLKRPRSGEDKDDDNDDDGDGDDDEEEEEEEGDDGDDEKEDERPAKKQR